MKICQDKLGNFSNPCPCFHQEEKTQCSEQDQYGCGGLAARQSIKLGLCEGRHIITGIEGYIYPQEVDPLNIEGLRAIVLENFSQRHLNRGDHLDLYVTGLTVALIEVINICHTKGISLTLWHYNRDDGTYYPQEVI